MKQFSLAFWLLLFVFPFLIVTPNSLAQEDLSTSFRPVTIAGEIPQLFLLTKEEYIQAPFKNMSSEGLPKEKIEAFSKLYRTNLHELFWSGNILFGDEFSTYLNQIKNEILAANSLSHLSQEITCYTWKTSKTEPKTLIDGSILVPIGLISKIQNEAQLAFLISHEISTYQQIKDKEFTSFVTNTGSLNQSAAFYDMVSDFNSTFTKNESSNDLNGYSLYQKTSYNQEDALDLLLVMQFASLPYGEKKISTDFFDTQYGELPSSFFTNFSDKLENNVAEIEATEKSIRYELRITKLSELIQFEKGVKFKLYSEESYRKLAAQARFENQLIHIENKNYFQAINESYALQQEYPNNPFLEDCLIESLYALAKKETNFSVLKKKKVYFKTQINSAKSDKENTEIETTQDAVESLIQNTTARSLRYLTINYIEEKGKERHQKLANDLLFDLIHRAKENFDMEKEVVKKERKDELTKSEPNPKKITPKTNLNEVKKIELELMDSLSYTKLSKVEKINYQRKLKKYTDYQKYLEDKKLKDSLDLIVNESGNTDSLELTNEQIERFDEIAQNEKRLSDQNFIQKSIQNWKKNPALWQKIQGIEGLDSKLNYRKYYQGISGTSLPFGKKLPRKLSLDSILCLEPTYEVSDSRRLITNKVKYKEQEMKNEALKKSLKTSIESNTNNSSVAFSTGENDLTIATVSTIMKVNKWKSKLEFSSSDYEQFPLLSEYTPESEIDKKYKYILHTNISSDRVSRSASVLLIGVVSFVFAPLAIGVFVTPKYRVDKSIKVTNRMGETVYQKTIHPKQRPNVFLDKIFVEDAINQISSK